MSQKSSKNVDIINSAKVFSLSSRFYLLDSGLNIKYDLVATAAMASVNFQLDIFCVHVDNVSVSGRNLVSLVVWAIF